MKYTWAIMKPMIGRKSTKYNLFENSWSSEEWVCSEIWSHSDFSLSDTSLQSSSSTQLKTFRLKSKTEDWRRRSSQKQSSEKTLSEDEPEAAQWKVFTTLLHWLRGSLVINYFNGHYPDNSIIPGFVLVWVKGWE